MFSSISNYLFGTSEPDQPQEDQAKCSKDATNDSMTTTNFKLSNGSDEWVLVERAGKSLERQPEKQLCPEIDSSSHSITDNNVCLDSFHNPQPHGHLSEHPLVCHDYLPKVGEFHDASDSDVSSGTHPSMDGSWLVTPPACFTAGISQMETSSMENLLIEHPSMSVYQHRGRHSSTGLDSEHSESSSDEEQLDHDSQQQTGQRQVAAAHRPRAINAYTGLTQVQTIRAMQKARQCHVYKDLSKKNLRRSNLTHYTQGKAARKQPLHQPRSRKVFAARKH